MTAVIDIAAWALLAAHGIQLVLVLPYGLWAKPSHEHPKPTASAGLAIGVMWVRSTYALGWLLVRWVGS